MQPPFPVRPGDAWATPSGVAAHGFDMRPLRDEDEPWLRDLYASTRADELACVPWGEPMRRAFCDQQFDLQHRHFMAHYRGACFLAIQHHIDRPAGRLYLDRAGEHDLVIDIALFPAFRGRGIGGALLGAVLDGAAARGRATALHVAHHNLRARRLYERLGFVPVASSPSHLLMRRQPPADVS